MNRKTRHTLAGCVLKIKNGNGYTNWGGCHTGKAISMIAAGK